MGIKAYFKRKDNQQYEFIYLLYELENQVHWKLKGLKLHALGRDTAQIVDQTRYSGVKCLWEEQRDTKVENQKHFNLLIAQITTQLRELCKIMPLFFVT